MVKFSRSIWKNLHRAEKIYTGAACGACDKYQVCMVMTHYRPAQLAELPRSKFDPELFPHSAYVKIFVTFATKVPYFNILRQKVTNFDAEMEREGGNGERMRKWRESFSFSFLILSPFPLHFLILSPFPLHFLILSPFPRSPAARLQRVVTPCHPPENLHWQLFLHPLHSDI